MIQVGLIEMAYDESFTLKVSEFGRRVLKLNLKIELANAAEVAEESNYKTSSEPKFVVSSNNDLLVQLKSFRKDLAVQLKVPPYVIFTDKTLSEIVEREPITDSDLLAVPGISAKKMQQAGNQIIDIVRTYKGLGAIAAVSIDEILHPDKIKSYLKQLNQIGLEPTIANLAKALAGNKDGMFNGFNLKDLNFYGKLAGKFQLKEIKPMIEKKLQNLFHSSIPMSENSDSSHQSFENIFNHFTAEDTETLNQAVDALPDLRPSDSIQNQYILEQRKAYQRAYEPWEDIENNLLLNAASKTNDTDFLANTFKRNPPSLKTQLAKLLLKQQILAGD